MSLNPFIVKGSNDSYVTITRHLVLAIRERNGGVSEWRTFGHVVSLYISVNALVDDDGLEIIEEKS